MLLEVRAAGYRPYRREITVDPGVPARESVALVRAETDGSAGGASPSGPGAVGDSTTRAVVAGIVLTIIADAVIGVVYFYLGI